MPHSSFYQYLNKTLPLRKYAVIMALISIPFWILFVSIFANKSFYTEGFRDFWSFTLGWHRAGTAIVENCEEAEIPIRSQVVRYYRVQFRYHLAQKPFTNYENVGVCYCRDYIEPDRKNLVEGKSFEVLIFRGNRDIAKLNIPTAVRTGIWPNRLYGVGGFLLLAPTWVLGMIWLEYHNGKKFKKKKRTR